MYNQDSFFDLTPWGQAGLATISLVLFAAMMAVTWSVVRGRPVGVRLAGALVAFWLFVWVSPQVYYTYYRMIIPDLPLQWVIWPPAAPQDAAALMTFQGPHSLSAHSQGLLGWALVVLALVARRRGTARGAR